MHLISIGNDNYIKTRNQYCANSIQAAFAYTEKDAKTKCNANDNCKAFMQFYCTGQYYMCNNWSEMKTTNVDHCVFHKGKSYMMGDKYVYDKTKRRI